MERIIVEYRDNKHYLKDEKGNLISETGFDWIDNEMDPRIEELTEDGDTATLIDNNLDWIQVTVNHKENFINIKGEFISDDWFDDIFHIGEKWIDIGIDNKYNCINKNDGKYISEEWFDWFGDNFENHDWISVQIGEKHNLLNEKGEFFFETWVDATEEFKGDWAQIRINRKANLINRQHQYFSEEWFEEIAPFDKGWAYVKQNGKWNLINEKKEYFVDDWFEFKRFDDGSRECIFNREDFFCEVWMKVFKNGKYNFINQQREYISEVGFDKAEDFSWGTARVEKDDKRYILDTNGDLKEHEEEWEPLDIIRYIDRYED